MIKYSQPKFKSVTDAKNFVRECEIDFEARLSLLTEQVCGEKELKVITLSGPTCSGKTTASKKLVEAFAKHSKRINIISIDDFYYDKDKLHELSRNKGMDKVDYDSVDTIDLDSLCNVVEEIFDEVQGDVHIPVFDFVEGKRVGYKTLQCTDNDIFVFEGIQALYPQVHALFEKHSYCDIFICVESSIAVGDTIFEPNEIRLLRRLVRDNNFRATHPDFTFNMWDSVRENEEKNIFPYSHKCKYKVDSAFPCEISLLKPYLEKTLPLFNENDLNHKKAKDILNKLSGIEELPKEYLSDNSFYFEFI